MHRHMGAAGSPIERQVQVTNQDEREGLMDDGAVAGGLIIYTWVVGGITWLLMKMG
jgi:hypothetical protein